MKRDAFTPYPDDVREVRHFHLCGAIGGGAKGFNRGQARVGNMVAKFRCIGSVDVDEAANRDFHRLVGVPATTRDRFGLVTVASEYYAIADIGMRMLTPRELFRAQGFPEDYIIDHGIGADGQRVTLTKTAQVRMCGNSVCPPLAAAIVRANLEELAIRRAA